MSVTLNAPGVLTNAAETTAGVVDLATNALGRDAWGKPKVVFDKSVYHALFTYSVSDLIWLERFNGVEQAITNASSVDGKLVLTSNAGLAHLATFRSPRYEPNRGHLFSTSVFLPTPTAAGRRRFGLFTVDAGVFFELVAGGLYAVVRTTIQGVTSDDRYLLDTTGIDLSKGQLYDIQYQWRGVGNYRFFIGLTEVFSTDYRNSRIELTSYNPANPVAFEAENLGADVEVHCGCADITSEGGTGAFSQYGSVGVSTDSGEVAFTGYNQPVLAIRSKLLIGTAQNTRNTIALLLTAYANEKAMIRVWTTRDFTAITDGNSAWVDYGDGAMESIERTATAGTMAFDTAKANLVFTARVEKEGTYTSSALFGAQSEIFLAPGSMLVFTLHRENGAATSGGVTFEFTEEL